MICGRDEHGGNVQAGCQRRFDWRAARPYVSSLPLGPLPAFPWLRMSEAEAARAMAVLHCDGPLRRAATRCCACGGALVGPRFDCLACPGGLTVCVRCEPRLAAGGHPAWHVLRVRVVPEPPPPAPLVAPRAAVLGDQGAALRIALCFLAGVRFALWLLVFGPFIPFYLFWLICCFYWSFFCELFLALGVAIRLLPAMVLLLIRSR